MTFEIIQADGQPLRFDDSYFWEYFAEEMADAPDLIKEDRTIVRVYRLDKNDERVPITDIYRPLRVDYVTDDTALKPMFKRRTGSKCTRCGYYEF